MIIRPALIFPVPRATPPIFTPIPPSRLTRQASNSPISASPAPSRPFPLRQLRQPFTMARLSIAATAWPRPSAAPRSITCSSPMSRMRLLRSPTAQLTPKAALLPARTAPSPCLLAVSFGQAIHALLSSPTASFPISPRPPQAPARIFTQIIMAFMLTAEPRPLEPATSPPPPIPSNKPAPAIFIWPPVQIFTPTELPSPILFSCPNCRLKPPPLPSSIPIRPFPAAQPSLPSRLARPPTLQTLATRMTASIIFAPASAAQVSR